MDVYATSALIGRNKRKTLNKTSNTRNYTRVCNANYKRHNKIKIKISRHFYLVVEEVMVEVVVEVEVAVACHTADDRQNYVRENWITCKTNKHFLGWWWRWWELEVGGARFNFFNVRYM